MLEDYFMDLDTFEHSGLFKDIDVPWEIIPRIATYIEEWFKKKESMPEEYQSMLSGATFHKVHEPDHPQHEKMVVVQYPVRINQPVYLKPWRIFIGKGTILESNIIIKSPAIIGENCQIRHTAYLRGNTIIGNNCVAGHCTEVKNSVFMDGACAGHFAYVGDSVLGANSNLGAGTKLANLEFRTMEEKKSRNLRSIVITCNEQKFDTKMQKLGAIIGDGAETGCNSVLAPCVMLGKNSWVFPNTFVRKGIYAPVSQIDRECYNQLDR